MVSINLSEGAAKKVAEFSEKQGKNGNPLRIWVSGGGCSGFQYGLAFDEKKEDDLLVSSSGVQVVVDPVSAKYLDGIHVDYVETLEGAGFQIKNPNARSSCACGNSFEA
ncbi:MAG: iron-sulfur cluster insertion protein ErpA [Candidatus Bathyarchaeia archaeon]